MLALALDADRTRSSAWPDARRPVEPTPRSTAWSRSWPRSPSSCALGADVPVGVGRGRPGRPSAACCGSAPTCPACVELDVRGRPDRRLGPAGGGRQRRQLRRAGRASRSGRGPGRDDVVLVTLGTGIGGGLVVGGRRACAGPTGSPASPATWSSTRTGRRARAVAGAAGSATPRAAAWPGMARDAAARRAAPTASLAAGRRRSRRPCGASTSRRGRGRRRPGGREP